MEKCRRMKRPQFLSKNWIYSWLWKSSGIRQQLYRSESFAMNMDTLTSGSTVKNHISWKTLCGYSAIRKTSYRSWFLVCQKVFPPVFPLQHQWHLQGRKLIILRLPQARLPHHPWHLQLCQANVWKGKNGETRTLLKQKSRWLNQPKSKNPCHSDIPERLQEFRENLVDDRVPERRDSHASSSHGLSLEPMRTRLRIWGKHSVKTHFPKDRNCEICQRTKITKDPVQKTHWQSRTSCRKFLWFDYSRSQSSQWRLWISKQSSICNRGAGLGHPVDPVVSVENKNFSGNTKELAKVLGAEYEA